MSRGRRIAIIVACIVAGFIIACVVVAPRYFKIDRYRPYIISVIEQRTGRQVTIGRIGLAVFPVVAITADDFAIANPRGFPAGNWITVKRIRARPDLGALWHHRIVIRSLSLSRPVLNLLSDARGRWNYELTPPHSARNDPPGDPASASAARQGSAFTLEEISDLSLKDGSVSMASLSAGGAASPPMIAAEGVSSDLKNINLAAFAAPHSPQAGLANATGTLHLSALGAANLRLTHVTASVQATPQQVQLRSLKFDFYDGHGQADVRLHLATPVLQYNVQGGLDGVNAQELLSQFPQARGQLTGTIESRFNFSGAATSSPDPWAGKQGQGTLIVRKGRLPKLHLDQALLELTHVAELGPRSGSLSTFSLISFDWQLERGIVKTPKVRILGNGISVTGSGTLDLAAPGRLSYVATAEIAAKQNPLTNLLAGFSGATFANGKLSLPFVLGGTLDRPLFRLNTGALLGQATRQPAAKVPPAPQLLQNLFHALRRKK